MRAVHSSISVVIRSRPFFARKVHEYYSQIFELFTVKQRIAALCKKYSDLLEDRRLAAKHLKQSQKESKNLKLELEKEAKARQMAEKLSANHKGRVRFDF